MTKDGRRERGKREKQERIHAAAASLFAERGYNAVTTQDIADRADVAGGTLFRYATTKAELLLMVFNDDLRLGIEAGTAAANHSIGARQSTEGWAAGDTTDQPPGIEMVALIMALLHPLVASAVRHRENTAIYQRELLFGDPSGRYRGAGLELVGRVEALIAETLRGIGRSPFDRMRLYVGADVDLAARNIFASLHLELIHAAEHGDDAAELVRNLEIQVAQVVQGISASTGTTNGA